MITPIPGHVLSPVRNLRQHCQPAVPIPKLYRIVSGYIDYFSGIAHLHMKIDGTGIRISLKKDGLHPPQFFLGALCAVVCMGEPHHGRYRACRADAAFHPDCTRTLPCGTEEQFAVVPHTRGIGWTFSADAHRPVLHHHLFFLFRRHLRHFCCHFHEFVHDRSLSFHITTKNIPFCYKYLRQPVGLHLIPLIDPECGNRT